MRKIFLLLLFSSILSFSQYGVLDVQFSDDGIVIEDFVEIPDLVSYDVISLLNISDRLYVVGNYKYDENGITNKNIYIARFNSDGDLDLSFGINGFRLLSLNSNSEVHDAIITDTNDILLVGSQKSETNRTMIVKINEDGNFDSAFGIDGVYIDSELNTVGRSIFVSLNNSLVIGVMKSLPNGSANFSVLKLFNNGIIDTSFGNNGRTEIDLGYDIPQKIIEYNDKILFVGESFFDEGSYRLILIQFNFDGTLDSSFGTNGIVIESIDNSSYDGSDVVIQNDGTLLVSSILYLNGNNGSNFCLINFNSNGSLNTNFGENGYSLIGNPEFLNSGYKILFNNDSKPILTGYSNEFNNDMNFAILRFNPNGTLDNTFGENGVIKTDLNNTSYDWSRTSTVQYLDKIVMAGKSDDKIALVRYWVNNPLEVEDISTDSKIQIAPNPTSNSFVINGLNGNQTQVQIIDLTGKIIQEFQSVQNNQTLNLGSIPKGAYIIKIHSKNKIESKKLIVK